MQALAERLAAAIGGHRLVGADPLGFTALKTVTPPPDALVGHVVEEVDRRGKYVLLGFDDGNRIAMHLSQAGRVDIEERPKTTRPKGAVVRLRFATADGETGARGAGARARHRAQGRVVGARTGRSRPARRARSGARVR